MYFSFFWTFKKKFFNFDQLKKLVINIFKLFIEYRLKFLLFIKISFFIYFLLNKLKIRKIILKIIKNFLNNFSNVNELFFKKFSFK